MSHSTPLACGVQLTSTRVAVHSLAGCVLYGEFTAKVLLVNSRRLPGWTLPAAGGLARQQMAAAGNGRLVVPRIGDMTSDAPRVTLKASRLPCAIAGIRFQLAGRAPLTAACQPVSRPARTGRRRRSR